MKLWLFLVAAVALTAPRSSLGASQRLTGCPDPITIATALAKLARSNWREFSLVELRALWPTELVQVDCESADGCLFVQSRSRVIRNTCECCDGFRFNLKRNDDASHGERLSAVFVQYSTHLRRETVAAAKVLVRATGMADAEVATVGRDSSQNFQWSDAQGHETYVDVRFTRLGPVWHVHLSITRELMGTPSPKSKANPP